MSLPGAAFLSRVFPGIMVAALVAVAAQFFADHYGAPAMLMALLLGMPLNFLADGVSRPGLDLAARTILRAGVAMLGVRMGIGLLEELGLPALGLLLSGVVATILFGVACARLAGLRWTFGLLTGGSVAICGASAAMAIAATLPRRDGNERDLVFTVLGVTVLSTIAMIAYPLIAAALGMDDHETGLFLGGTIHDVAQVVGAGFSVSQTSGETATLVKLIRVTALAPVVLACTLLMRFLGEHGSGGKRPPLLPGFVVVFLVLAALNSFGQIHADVQYVLWEISRWMLLVAVASVGVRTSLAKILEVGGKAISLVIAETVFIGVLIVTGMLFFRSGLSP